MSHLGVVMLVAVGFLLSQMAERNLDKANTERLKIAGGEDLSPKDLDRFYFCHRLLVILALFETLILWNPLQKEIALSAAVIMILGAGLKFWAIYTLGYLWTKSCVYVYGVKPVITGPYRFFRHPEYLGRLIESAAMIVLLQSFLTGIPLLLLMWFFVSRVGKMEQRQMSELAPKAWSKAHTT